MLLAFELAEREMVETGAHPELNFVIIGGGPTGVELAGAISDISKLYMRHDFRHIDPSKARVILIEGSPRILAAYPEDLSKKAVAAARATRSRSTHRPKRDGRKARLRHGRRTSASMPWSRYGQPASRPRPWAKCWACPPTSEAAPSSTST